VDEAYKRLLEKHESLLAKSQEKLILQFKQSFKNDIDDITNQVNRISHNIRLIFESLDEIRELKIIKDILPPKKEKVDKVVIKTKKSKLHLLEGGQFHEPRS